MGKWLIFERVTNINGGNELNVSRRDIEGKKRKEQGDRCENGRGNKEREEEIGRKIEGK